MRIVAISCVRNEADIIEPFVRHTLSYCERMIILNHGSTDATVEILDQLRGEGLPLQVVHDATLGHMLVAQMNRLLHLAANEYAADWILPLDADEFISGSRDASFLQPHIEGKTPCLKLHMRTYYAKPGDDPKVLNPVERMTQRLAQEPSKIQKVLVPGYLAREAGNRLVQGNHRLILGAREAPFEIVDDVWLAHFSLRSPSQYALKIASKHLQRLRGFAAHGVEAKFYKETYTQLKRSYSAFATSFETQPLATLPPHDQNAVITDPLEYLGGPLRHTSKSGDFDEFSGQLLMLAERLASSGGGTDGVPTDSQSGSAPLFSVEVYPYPERGARDERHVPGYPAATHSFEFDLDCDAATKELRIGFGCAPGMLEIEEIFLEYGGDQSAVRAYRHPELNSVLRVLYQGAAINTGRAYWLFISAQPVLLSFCHRKDEDERQPRKLRLKLCYQNRMLEGKFLHPAVLNAITQEQRESERLRQELESSKKSRENLLEHVIYSIGSTIDFSNKGNGALFMRKGWCRGEVWGTWTDGCEAVLQIRFAEIPRSDLRLNACLRAFMPAGHAEMRVNIRVNGKRIAAWTVKNRDFATLRSEIDLASVQGGECEIVFEIENPISPRQAGISNDGRLLGLGFKSVDLQPQQLAA